MKSVLAALLCVSISAIAIPSTAATKVSYGQDAHRRIRTAIGLAVVGLNWQDVEKKSGFAMLCDKNENRGILTGLEGVTGNKAVDTDALTVKN